MARLAISDADRVQAASLPNPHLALSRLREGRQLSIERMLSFNVVNLVTLPWRARYADQQTQLARLNAAQDIVRTATLTRKAWVRAVAAGQSLRYMEDAREAAAAGAGLAQHMARRGNWSRLQQAREQSTLADVDVQLARARHQAVVEREALTRLLGLQGTQTAFVLTDLLPGLPAELPDRGDIEAQALRERLDVRAATDEARYVAEALGYQRVAGVIDALEVGVVRNTHFDNAAGTRRTERGTEISLPLPLFDWGQAGAARSQALYMQAVARVRESAVRARSEAREAWQTQRNAYALARHYRDEVVPLRKLISDETVLLYNGMLASVWELLAETRAHIAAVNGAIDTQRDFWLADADLAGALTGTSPTSTKEP